MYNQGKIMRRLLGRSTDSSVNENSLGVASSPSPQFYRPNTSQNAVHPASAPVSCLDRSFDGQFAVLGGRNVFKTVQINGANIKEGIDVRAIITSQQMKKPSVASSTTSEQLSIKDVKWAEKASGATTLFTACANGKIFQYDVARLGSAMPGGTGLEYIQIREDTRQINKLDINPHKHTWLLSGSQDGTLRLFDVREPVTYRNGHSTFRSNKIFKCNADPVLDVKWCPTDGVIFACSTESGAVLKWDVRKFDKPLLRLNSHDIQKGTSSISWHPDGNHLMSAGDNKCFVWDMSGDRKQKPKHTISTPAPVSSVAWRPGLWSVTAQGRRAAQVAVSYVDGGSGNRYGVRSVHLWDLARPTMPFKEIGNFESSPNALLWHDQDLLWTAGSDGLFTQCDVAFAPKVIDRQSLSGLDFSPRGDVAMVLDERYSSRPKPSLVTQDMLPTSSSYSSSPSGQMLSISRSDSEDDVVGSFLGPRKHRKRRPSPRSTNTLSTTPPSVHVSEEPVLPLEQAVSVTGTFRSQQILAIGHVPVASKVNVYQYLSEHYLETLHSELPPGEGLRPLNDRVAGIMEHYARAAENVSLLRLAQTWRILAYAMNLLLTRRSQYHLELRTLRAKKLKSPSLQEKADSRLRLLALENSTRAKVGGEETPRKPPSVTSADGLQTHARSLLADEIDSESNVPTPLARPAKYSTTEQESAVLTPVEEIGSFALPPAAHQQRPPLRPRLDSTPLSIMSQDSQISSTDGYDFYDLSAGETLPMAIKKREPLSLDYVGPVTPNSRRLKMARHDSDESFAQMFSVSDGNNTTSDGSHQTTAPSGSYASQHEISETSGVSVGSSGTPEAEFASRIRRKPIHESPKREQKHMARLPGGEDSGSLGDISMLSQTTADNDSSEHSLENSQGHSEENSHGSLYIPTPGLRVTKSTYPRKISDHRLTQKHPEEQTSPTVTETDFMPWPEDPPYPFPLPSEESSRVNPQPLEPYSLISQALEFEAQRSALTASAMVLLLKPLVPDDIIDSYQAAAILRQHHKRLMDQKLFMEASLLRNMCIRDWPDGIEVWGDNYPAIYAAAQETRRVAVGYSCLSCEKAREVNHSEPDSIWKCDSCDRFMAPCAICGHRNASSDLLAPIPFVDDIEKVVRLMQETPLSTWWYCYGCSHGGHATCLQGWHSAVPPTKRDSGIPAVESSEVQDDSYQETYSGGCCPVDSCGHACLPGRWREETSTARTEELGRVVREQTRSSLSSMKSGERRISNIDSLLGSAPSVVGGIRSDRLEAPPSRAVEGVREALIGAGIETGSGPNPEERRGRAGGILSVLSSSPKGSGFASDSGRPERHERERRKSVKFAAGAAEERR